MTPWHTVGPRWAALTVWGVVNAVNVLQAVGFFSRVRTGGMAVNRAIGYVFMGLAIPASLAFAAFVRTRAPWVQRLGPAVYLAFVAFMIAVDYVWRIEFRSPMRPGLAIPYLVLFFGSILLMGVPMYRIDVRLWLITVSTTLLLLGAMGVAIRAGVG